MEKKSVKEDLLDELKQIRLQLNRFLGHLLHVDRLISLGEQKILIVKKSMAADEKKKQKDQLRTLIKEKKD